MYELFVRPARRFTGAHTFVELAFLKRFYARAVQDVQTYYRQHPKRVDSDNRLANLLLHIPRRWDLDDRRYVRFVEDAASGVSRAFGFTSSVFRGKVHEGGVTLGPKTDEIILTTVEEFPVEDAASHWREWAAYRYLYHTRADLGLPILNNTTPGRGYGIGVVNIPMLATQYRHWLIHQGQKHDEQKESLYRFLGSVVLPNTLPSYLDIAFFNRLSRQARGVGTPKYPTPHPFYLTDYSQRVDKLCERILDTQERRSGDLEQVVQTTPVLGKESLWDTMRLPKDPVTRHNEWALQLARLPYCRYLVDTAVHADRGDRHFLNELYLTLVEASHDRIFSGVGAPDVVKQYRQTLREMIGQLEEKRQGWA